jgi:pimeloyl-ACP methyl ester carboxylesterase
MIVVGVLVVAVVGVVVAVAWYFSNAMLVPQPYSLMPEFEVVSATADMVTLPLPPSAAQFADTTRTGTYNLIWDGGYGQLGEVVSQDETSLTRGYTLTEGSPPEAGDPARLEAFVFLRDPLQDHGLAFEEVRLEADIGPLHAWWLADGADFSGEDDAAVLMLHGRRRSSRLETLRILPTLRDMGYPVLSLAYRNHDQSPMSPDGFFHYGASEWQDALLGLKFLQEQGAERIVIYAYSMGGAVTLETMERLPELGEAELADALIAIVLDAPLSDPRTVFETAAVRSNLPAAKPLTRLTMWLSGLRSGVDWQSLDQRETIDQVELPMLLIHGTTDLTVPVSLSDALAAANDSIIYQRVEGVEHGEAWNQNPERYEAWVREFLGEHAAP